MPDTRVFRALHFPHRRREVVSEVNPTPINVQPGEILYDEDANKLYAGLEDTTVVEIGGGSGNPFDQTLNTTDNVTFNDVLVNSNLLFKAFNDNTDRMSIIKVDVNDNTSVLKITIGDDAGTTANVNSYYPTSGIVDYVAIVTENGDSRHLFGADGKYYNAGGITFVDNTTQTSAGVTSVADGITGASRLTNIVKITQAGYNALATKDPATVYYIVAE